MLEGPRGAAEGGCRLLGVPRTEGGVFSLSRGFRLTSEPRHQGRKNPQGESSSQAQTIFSSSTLGDRENSSHFLWLGEVEESVWWTWDSNS